MSARLVRGGSLTYQQILKTSSRSGATRISSPSVSLASRNLGVPLGMSVRNITNVASTSTYPTPAPLRLEPPTAREETDDFNRACEEVQKWWDSPRFAGIKVGCCYDGENGSS